MGKYGAFPGMGNMQNLMRQSQKMQAYLQKKTSYQILYY